MATFSNSVMVLGSEYKIKVSDKKKDKSLDDCDGYCKVSENIIGVRDLHDDDDWKSESESHIRSRMKKILRHEIVHAFLHQSGLSENACVYFSAWSINEEMVDWFAIQGAKIYKAWKEAGAL